MFTHTIIEPFRIRTVEPISARTRDERSLALHDAHFNVFQLRASDVLIDLLTDSGTGAMSANQWSAMMRSDESYAGARSFFTFERAVRDITGLHHVLPTHQGRAAERILFTTLLKPGDIVPNNTHFDTTRANIEDRGATALDIPVPEARDPGTIHPFKGNIDLIALEEVLRDNPGRVPLAMITVTNNSGGGQPVSLANLREARAICDRYGVPLYLDACRFAENAWFIHLREPGQEHRSPTDIARDMFACVVGCTMSAKKDGMANIGGFLALNDDGLAQRCRNNLILTEGFTTYGGLAGYDLEAIAVGLREALQDDYLKYRIRSIEYLSEKLAVVGVPMVQPPGGHALYIDAKGMLGHIPPSEFPAWTLSCALYLEAGIRAVEIGSVMFGQQPDGSERPARMELLRLAFPRRVYTQSHVDYVAEAVLYLHARRGQLRGMRITEQPPSLRHFTVKMAPLDPMGW